MEQSIGVFGQDVLLWACLLRQAQQRPAAQQVHQHATWLLDELERSPEARQLPVDSVKHASFAICALLDEWAMTVPELRPVWSQYMLQAQRHNTNNAGVELFHRLEEVRKGPPSVIATYAVVLGLGFQGCYGLPGADRYALFAVRRDLSIQLGVDPDRDRAGGTLRKIHVAEVENLELFEVPWYKSRMLGRGVGIFLLVTATIATILVLVL